MISVLTLVRGRGQHLDNLLAGLEHGTELPDELVIVHMNESAAPRHSNRFPVVTREVSSQTPLPLAVARNHAADIAVSDRLIFLDVDCIPYPTLVADYRRALSNSPEALHQGDVRYLPACFSTHDLGQRMKEAWNAAGPFEAMQKAALYHPLHTFRSGHGAIPYELFWSLNFACHRSVFETIGGFDTRYAGYGGEDTDFSFRARRNAVPLITCAALAFHQFHPTYEPPLNHLDDIVKNAEVFKSIWGDWPMSGWLHEFERRGFIRVHANHIECKRSPTRQEIDESLNADQTGF